VARETAELTGTVLGTTGGVYEVETEGGLLVEASLRGRLKQEQRTGDRVVAGDRVEILRQEDGSYTIETVRPRAAELVRCAPGRGAKRAKVIVANVDQVVVVFAAAHPPPNTRMLDRFLVLIESNQIPALIVVNKIELVAESELESTFSPYPDAGYEVLRTSVKTGAGIDQLRDRLKDRESVLTGPSGVGKSSLLNTLQPGLDLRIGEVSGTVDKGRHTTVSARLIRLHFGGWVADTPGLRELGLWEVDTERLQDYFPEFRARSHECRFASRCTHTHEPACAVRLAVDAGSLSPARYQSYLAMRGE
jgi:ribosome biogenesis GTPase